MDNSKITIETNNRKYQELIEVPNAVIFHLDRNWNYSSLNLEWTHLTAYTVDETLATSFLDYVKEEERMMIKEQFDSLIQGKNDGIHKEFMDDYYI